MNINSSSNNNNNMEMDIEHDGQMYIISNFSSNSEGNNHNVTTIEINGNILEEDDNESRRSHIEQFINLAQDLSNSLIPESSSNMETDNPDIESNQEDIDPDYQYAMILQEQEYRLANRNSYIGSTRYHSPLTTRRLGNTNLSNPNNRNNNPYIATLNNITNNITSFMNNTRNTRNNRNLTNILNSENNTMNIRGIFANLGNPSSNVHREIFTNLQDRLRNYENVSVTLDENDYNKLPISKYSNLDTTKIDCNKCTICLANFDNEDLVKILPCQHIFHNDCINVWLQNYNYKCPICRKEAGKGKPNL